ncbi:MAG: Gfo/Idh/MocA family oxidoreductase [Aetokthonos hydrillicola CCALA 1050]|jgi:predicted dehydrogenase|nr:Gfo/Idh/MocA family oxidoreductase [Aetokthonos hydrillicola CCALA 1050]
MQITNAYAFGGQRTLTPISESIVFMRVAIIGCGFVADFYMRTISLYPNLELVGVMDRNSARASKFSTFYSVPKYNTLQEVLSDPKVDIVLNLTNPSSHYSVSKASLEAGKHVYSEKPLAMDFSEAKELVEIAEKQGLYISSAPCSLLGETAQSIWKALREQQVGKVRLVYAEMDDGLIHKVPYKKWVSKSGTPWPYKDEFEVGCTLEHAGYYITWLPAFFGPAETVTAFSDCLVPDKLSDEILDVQAPDFSVACIKFASGVVARLTCSIIAPHDHELKIIGDEGIISVKDCWHYEDPVYVQRRLTLRRKTIENPFKQNYPLVRKIGKKGEYNGRKHMDYCRGVAELANAIAEKYPPYLSAKYCLHTNEIVLAIQNAWTTGAPYKVTTSFQSIAPMRWAK